MFIGLSVIKDSIDVIEDSAMNVIVLVVVLGALFLLKKRTKLNNLNETYYIRKKIHKDFIKKPNLYVFNKSEGRSLDGK